MRPAPVVFIIAVLLLSDGLCVKADVIELKDLNEKITGRVISEDATHVTVKLTGTGTCTFPRSLIKSIKKEEIPDSKLYTKSDIYYEKARNVDQGDANAHLELARWCIRNSGNDENLTRMAVYHYRKAKELNPQILVKDDAGLIDAMEKEAGQSYSIAEAAFSSGEYLKAEKYSVFTVVNYPDTKNSGKARELIITIWGRDRIDRILDEGGGLPDIVLSPEELNAVLQYLKDEDLKARYFTKYLNKAMDFEERAKEVGLDRKQGYYTFAIECYDAASKADKEEIRNLSDSKIKSLLKSLFEDTPVPYDNLNYMFMVKCLERIDDNAFVERVSQAYYKEGVSLYDKAKRSKQPEKAQRAKNAYFCFNIVNNFSNDAGIKQKSFEYLINSQRLERSR